MRRRHDVRDRPTVDALQPWRIATMRERLMGLLLFVCVLAGYLFSFTTRIKLILPRRAQGGVDRC